MRDSLSFTLAELDEQKGKVRTLQELLEQTELDLRAQQDHVAKLSDALKELASSGGDGTRRNGSRDGMVTAPSNRGSCR